MAADRDEVSLVTTNGVLREYWTNFPFGNLEPLTGPKPFESILSVPELRVTARDTGVLPEPCPIALNQRLPAEQNYAWAEAQGIVTFNGSDGRGGFLELSDGDARIQVRVLHCDPKSLSRFHNASVSVEGVCEGVQNTKKVLVPGLIWMADDKNISLIEATKANSPSIAAGRSSNIETNPATRGFFVAQGVITFNDRVLDKDVMVVQEDNTAVFVSLKDRSFEHQFEVGRWVDLGGQFQPGKNIPIINPLVVTERGLRAMPAPMPQPAQYPIPGNRDGRWTEVEGVVQSLSPNGTFDVMGSGGLLSVWVGKMGTNAMHQYVDAKLRLRGVLSLTTHETPLLLVPSMVFVDILKEAPADPFSLSSRPAEKLFVGDGDEMMSHRVKLAGNVTFRDKQSFFMQDSSGGVRVRPVEGQELQIGQAVEVVGFPGFNRSTRTLTEALVRPARTVGAMSAQSLDAGEGVSFKQAGTLVQIRGNLIAQRTENDRQVLELQEKQRVFEAELPLTELPLPSYAPGSRLQLTGVCDFPLDTAANSSGAASESPSSGAMKIWLRSASDVVLLRGPPWWTWKHTAVLVGIFTTVLAVLFLRIQLLRRRLERQLTISRQILESQENERRRIAVNLHDGLGQNLLVIKYQASLAMQPATDDSVLRNRLDAISGCASEAIEEVREITHALRPYQLDRLGLTQAIRATLNRAAENGPIVFASHSDNIDGLFDKESEIHVYRSVQEAVNNILKHSNATEATVVVKRSASGVSLSIRDNGHGFDAEAIHNSNSHEVGHGIGGIHERVRILGGTLMVESRPGQGTNLNIEIPIPVSAHET